METYELTWKPEFEVRKNQKFSTLPTLADHESTQANTLSDTFRDRINWLTICSNSSRASDSLNLNRSLDIYI